MALPKMNDRKRRHFSFLGMLALLVSFNVHDTTSREKNIPMEIQAVKKAIDRSASYILRNTKEDGMFEYRIDLDPTVRVKKEYNIIRHAGTLYAMSMFYEMQPDPQMRAAMERAGRYLRDESIAPLPRKEDLLAIWSKPEVSRNGKPLEAPLGGTGLGLVALLGLEKIHPGFTPLPVLQKLGKFILYMQKEDGSFYALYVPSMGGYDPHWTSLYYPGEAILGLLMLYEKDPSDVWINSAVRGLIYLAESRKNKTEIPLDHWALMATEKLFSILKNKALPVPEKRLIRHAIQISRAILQRQIDSDGHREGGFSIEGSTTTAATSLEGLLAARSILSPNDRIREEIDAAAHRGIAFLLRTQVREGKWMGAFPRRVGDVDKNTLESEDIYSNATEVRIDFVQHALSAMIRYLDLIDKK
jgi:hypothetical protein